MDEEGGGENEVVQPVNPAANAAANVVANPLANTVGVQPQNVTGNARQNAGAQPPLVQANHAQSSQRQRI
jgi:hypothetical protein